MAYRDTSVSVLCRELRGRWAAETGRLGEMMQESAQVALFWLRANAERYGIDPAFPRDSDVHLHVSGAAPKEGASAGVTMAAALASAFTGRPLRDGLAMTGGRDHPLRRGASRRRHPGQGAGRALLRPDARHPAAPEPPAGRRDARRRLHFEFGRRKPVGRAVPSLRRTSTASSGSRAPISALPSSANARRASRTAVRLVAELRFAVRAASRYVLPEIRSWASTTASATNVFPLDGADHENREAAVVRELADHAAPPAGAAA